MSTKKNIRKGRKLHRNRKLIKKVLDAKENNQPTQKPTKTMPTTINRSKLERFIHNLRGKIFQVCWTKKTGEVRCANVRKGVYKKLSAKSRGSKVATNSTSYITVYLMWHMQGNNFLGESGYRVINLDTISSITANGETLTVTPPVVYGLIKQTA